MKILSVLHLNPHYVVGDDVLMSRYCTEVILPVFDWIERCPEFRTSIQISGMGLEYLADEFPEAIAKLRLILSTGQVELLTTTYSPACWIAYPYVDLVSGVLLFRQVAARLDLPFCGVFLAHEAFFGAGLKVLATLGLGALCKDDYLSYFGVAVGPKGYDFSGLKVLVGSNHILQELVSSGLEPIENLPGDYAAKLQKTIKRARTARTNSLIQCAPYYWMHFGSGHYFVTLDNPYSRTDFFFDPGWADITKRVITERAKTHEYAHVSELLQLKFEPPSFLIFEGSWSASRSRGTFSWMGKNEQTWQDNVSLITGAWKARMRRKGGFALPVDLSVEADVKWWRVQLRAECADPLGWNPAVCEVEWGNRQVQLALAQGKSYRAPPGVLGNRELISSRRPPPPIAQFSFENAFGELTVESWTDDSWLYVFSFEGGIGAHGVLLQLRLEQVSYCPSGLEHEIVSFQPSALEFDEVILPLTNGLFSVGSSFSIIRLNESTFVPAHISNRRCALGFFVTSPTRRNYTWKFIVTTKTGGPAVDMANEVNSV